MSRYITPQESQAWLIAQDKDTQAIIQRLIDDALDARDEVIEAKLRKVADEIMIKR